MADKLKLLCVVSCTDSNHGRGGHYYSALTVARELGRLYKLRFAVIGSRVPDAIKESGLTHVLVPFDVSVTGAIRSELRLAIDVERPDVILAFDMRSGQAVRPICATSAIGLVLVKAGGWIPSGYYPRNNYQVHFGKRELDWARRRLGAGRRNIVACIPNRVQQHSDDNVATEILRREWTIMPTDVIVARFGRIVSEYEPAFISTISCAEYLREQGFTARAMLVGMPAEDSVVQRLRSRLGSEDILLTDPQYTRDARRLLGAAQLNVGVGRGFMEGCAAGNFMLAPMSDGDLPVVVDHSNFDDFFADNFSMRMTCDVSVEERGRRLVALMSTLNGGTPRSSLAIGWFESNFAARAIPERYAEIIAAAAGNPERVSLDLFLGELDLRLTSTIAVIRRMLPKGIWLGIRAMLRQRNYRPTSIGKP